MYCYGHTVIRSYMFAEEIIGEWDSTFSLRFIIFYVPCFFSNPKHFTWNVSHVVQSTKVQLIIIYDLTLFTKKRNFGKIMKIFSQIENYNRDNNSFETF